MKIEWTVEDTLGTRTAAVRAIVDGVVVGESLYYLEGSGEISQSSDWGTDWPLDVAEPDMPACIEEELRR